MLKGSKSTKGYLDNGHCCIGLVLVCVGWGGYLVKDRKASYALAGLGRILPPPHRAAGSQATQQCPPL